MLISRRLSTPLGDMLALASPQGLCLLEFCDQVNLAREVAQVQAAHAAVRIAPGESSITAQTAHELSEYFAGVRTMFTVPLDWVGTAFQQAVWRVLLDIPFGQTCSYAEQARALGRPTAARAVAAANGRNKIPIIVPCHRVIGSDGSLTGFAAGLPRKRALLILEGSLCDGVD